jgi:plastocyanin
MRFCRSVLVVVPALAVLAACGGSSGGSTGGTDTGSGNNAPAPAATTAAAAPQKPTSLIAEVGKGDAFEIMLTDQSGNRITTLAAGTYTVAFKDESKIHNFHFAGGGVDQSTTVPETTERTMKITFAPGQYTFKCDPHAGSMKGTFTVT